MQKIVPKEIKTLIADCYFAVDHVAWLRFGKLSTQDRQIYFNSKEYKQLKTFKGILAFMSARPNFTEQMFGDVSYQDGNRMFWTYVEREGVSVEVAGVVSTFLDTLRLDTERFKQDRVEGRRIAFQKMRELTSGMRV